VKVFNAFNPSPLHLKENDLAFIQNFSHVNSTDHQNIATRRPIYQDISALTVDDIISDRTNSPEMGFDSEFSMGVWVKIPLENPFEDKLNFMEIYFSENGDRITLSLNNLNFKSKTEYISDSLELVFLEIPQNTWCFINVDYSVDDNFKILKVYLNDVLKINISERRVSSTIYNMNNPICSLGTNHFLDPYVTG
jgi:hypothetical protein